MMATFQQSVWRRGLVAWVMLVVVLAGRPASARDDIDLFTIVSLPVDAEAETAAKARDVALARGRSRRSRGFCAA